VEPLVERVERIIREAWQAQVLVRERRELRRRAIGPRPARVTARAVAARRILEDREAACFALGELLGAREVAIVLRRERREYRRALERGERLAEVGKGLIDVVERVSAEHPAKL